MLCKGLWVPTLSLPLQAPPPHPPTPEGRDSSGSGLSLQVMERQPAGSRMSLGMQSKGLDPPPLTCFESWGNHTTSLSLHLLHREIPPILSVSHSGQE